MSASLRLAVLRAERAWRAALHLSRLEVRRRRQVPRHAERAAGIPVQGQGPCRRLQGRRAQRRGLDLYGAGRGARAAGAAGQFLSRGRSRYRRLPPQLQLAPGARGRHRHLACRLFAWRHARAGARQRAEPPAGRGRERPGALRPAALRLYRQALQVRRLGDRLGRDVRRVPRGRRQDQLLAPGAVHLSVLDHHADLADRGPHLAARLGADGRHACARVRDQPQAGGAAAVARRARRQVPAEYDGLVRARPPDPERRERLPDRPRAAADESYSGIEGITQQDHAVTESMGPIANRHKEHLSISDRMIMVTRRHLIEAAVALRDKGAVPATVSRPGIYAEVTGGYFLAPSGQDLASAYGQQQANFMEKTKDWRMAAE